jgi:hypothetical protein
LVYCAERLRVHNADIHDRAIVIDRQHCLGASIKGMGAKLSVLNKLDDPNARNVLLQALEDVWKTARPL